tara:strand:+ start:1843 stop:2028 length:186 start_codon:yes stop_codon:yes gene_type:complete
MPNTEINATVVALLREIQSIKKPKEINPKLDEIEKLVEKQLTGLGIVINQLKQENKRLNGV